MTSLAWKLAAVVTLAICLVVGAQTFWSVHRTVDTFTDDFAADLEVQGRVLSLVAAELWRRDGPSKARGVLASLDDELQLREMHWHGDLETAPPVVAEANADWSRIARGDGVTISDIEGGRMVHYAPVRVGGTVTGALGVERSMAPALEERTSLIRAQLVFAALQIVICGLVVVFATRALVGRPMEALAAHARRIGEGDLSARLEDTRPDEIGRLMREMNQMTERLQEARQAIAEQARQRVMALEELRHAERLKTVGQLASGVAHELGTPLNVVSGRAQMIVRGQVQGDALVENAQVIVDQAKRMTRLIRHVLTFARRRPMPRGPLQLDRVVEESLALLEPTLKKARVTVEIERHGDDFTVPGESRQIEQVLANILMNAIHAMPGGGQIHIELHEVTSRHPDRADEEAFVCLSVTDAGVGMSDSVKARVFEPFFTTKQVNEGTGLGLSVAYGIVRDHGGWIDVESTEGEGTTFSLHFPRLRPDTSEQPATSSVEIPA